MFPSDSRVSPREGVPLAQAIWPAGFTQALWLGLGMLVWTTSGRDSLFAGNVMLVIEYVLQALRSLQLDFCLFE